MSKNDKEIKLENVVTEEVVTEEDGKVQVENEKQLDNLAMKAGKEVNKQKKVSVRVPKDPLNPKDHSVPVCINGYIWTLKRGEDIEVPEEVKRILDEAGYLG